MTSTRFVAGGVVIAAIIAGIWLLKRPPEEATESPGPGTAAAPEPAASVAGRTGGVTSEGAAPAGAKSVPFAPPEEGPPAAGSCRTRDPEDWTALTGRCVRAEDKSPLEGCEITVTGHQSTGYDLAWAHPDWRDPAPATSAADGRFRVRLGLPVWEAPSEGWSGRIHVTVSSPRARSLLGEH